MKAVEARKNTVSYEEPKTLKGILNRIKQYSKLGFANISFLIEDNEQRKNIIADLKKLGYRISDRSYNDYIEVDWF